MLLNEIVILVVFLLSIAAVYLLEFWFLANIIFTALGKKKGRRRFRTKSWILIHVLAGFGILCFAYGYFVEPYWIEVKTIPIQTDKLEQASFRIVHISDLHCDTKMRNERRIVELANQLEPDVIVFTGDALNTPLALPRFKQMMKDLKASMGKFAVYGNWDTGPWGELDYYSGTGFDLLHTDSITLRKNDETLSVSGLNRVDPRTAGEFLDGLPADRFNIFLYHTSDLVEEMDNMNVDLYLCGHTHGGQVALPFYGALITLSKFGKKYESGLYTVGQTRLYVSRGIGLDARPAPNVRFLARPEIIVFDIGPKR